MIKVRKSTAIPAVLASNGRAERARNEARYDDPATTAKYHIKYHKVTNPHKFKFTGKIYGHPNVKAQLKKDQNNKCCFCETSDVDVVAHGDVEHFRPKGGHQQNVNDQLGYPGYYWLAYEWDNLFFSCQICNQRYKKNRFPLVDPAQRATNQHAAAELLSNTLLVHPSREDPEAEIGFNHEIPFGKTDKGKKSIQAFGLKRDRLSEARRRHLDIVKSHLLLKRLDLSTFSATEISEILVEFGANTQAEVEAIVQSAVDFCNNAAKVDQPYTSMVRNNFPALPPT
jgi:uncharacterized protein (TIGR02646 family)